MNNPNSKKIKNVCLYKTKNYNYNDKVFKQEKKEISLKKNEKNSILNCFDVNSKTMKNNNNNIKKNSINSSQRKYKKELHKSLSEFKENNNKLINSFDTNIFQKKQKNYFVHIKNHSLASKLLNNNNNIIINNNYIEDFDSENENNNKISKKDFNNKYNKKTENKSYNEDEGPEHMHFSIVKLIQYNKNKMMKIMN